VCCELHVVSTKADATRQVLEMRKGFKRTIKLKGVYHVVFKHPCKYLNRKLCGIQNQKPLYCSQDLQDELKPLYKILIPKCGML